MKGADKQIVPEEAHKQSRSHNGMVKRSINLVQGLGEASLVTTEKERKGKENREEAKFGIGKISPAEELETIIASEGKSLAVENSARVAELEREIKAERKKYQRILAEDRKHRGSMCKDMYTINISIGYAKHRLERVKYMRIQMETLYNRNLALQSQIISLKWVIG